MYESVEKCWNFQREFLEVIIKTGITVSRNFHPDFKTQTLIYDFKSASCYTLKITSLLIKLLTMKHGTFVQA